MARTIRLKIALPDGSSTAHEFEQDSVIIGSGASAALKIDSDEVSSIHAIVKRTGGELTISDLGSDAGTSVNGKSITDEASIKPGDEIALGSVKLTLELSAAEESRDVAKKDNKETAKPDEKKKTEEPAAKAAETAAASDAKSEAKASKTSDDKAAAVESTEADKPAPKAEAKKADAPKAEAKKTDAPKADAKKGDVPKAEAKAEAKAAAKAEAKDAPAKKKPGARPGSMSVKADDDLNEGFLSDPLNESNVPTNEHHCLEVVAIWGNTVMDTIQVYRPRDVTVSGQATHHKHGDLCVEVPLPGLENHVFTIATNQGKEASIVIPSDAKVGLRTKDGKIKRDVALQPTDAPFPAKSLNIGFGERVAFKVGTVTFIAQYVRGDAVMGRRAPIDWYFPRIFIISALFHAFFVVAAFVTPKLTTNLTDDLFKNENRFAQMILKAPEKEKKRKKLDLSGSKGGAKHRDEEGKFGKKDKPKKDALASKAGAPRVDPNKREKDRKIAMNSGLLGILKGSAGSGAVSNVFGPGGLGTGINNAMGGLRGTAMGDAGGAGGLGTRGAGAGGGGNSLGIGGLGTHGHGRGTGGYGNIDLGGRGKGETRIVPGRTIIKGSLSKQEIGRVIRRNLARFKYCYEKELNSNPNLSGKISIYFTIAPTGSVAAASVRETSMNDENVESCTTKVMRSLKFPQPRGGGIVVVTYPFVFQST